MASRTVFRFLILLTALVWIVDAENVTRKRRDQWTNGSWFSLGFHDFEKSANPSDLYTDKSRMCAKLRGLTPGQRRICRRNKDHMPVVSAGVRRGIVECQHQFKDRRWNCTTTEDVTVFGPLTLIGSRETAFTHAVTSAGVSLSLSRACRDGRLASCGCGRTHRPPGLRAQWRWAGCGDDLHYSYTHGDLSKAAPGVQGRVRSDRLYQVLAGQLNSVNGGVVKSVDKWKKVWADWKTKTKKKYLNLQHARAAGRITPGRTQMTVLEDRVVAILSASANQGIQDLGVTFSNNDDSNNEIPQYGIGEVEVHISNIKDSPATSPLPSPQSPHMEAHTMQPQSPTHEPQSPQSPQDSEEIPTQSQTNRRQAATMRRLIQRARRNREHALNRMLTQFVTIENRRLQLEEEREQRLHEREMERLRTDSRRIEAAREQNRLLEHIAVIGQQIVEIIAQRGRN